MNLHRRFSSPLRYPGGKAILSDFIKELLLMNGLSGGSYVEPFAGGSGIALALLEDNVVNSIYLNDLDYGVYAFWYSLLNLSEEFLRLYRDTLATMDTWGKMKGVLNCPADYSCLDVGFAFFFLNRCNRSGIVNSGPIGGYQQNGKYKMDCRYNTPTLEKRITKIIDLSNKIHIYNKHAEDFICDDINKIEGKTLAFIDPPYFKKGHQLYLNHFTEQDHVNLYNTICINLNTPWIVTYDNTEEIKKIYSTHSPYEYKLNYSVHNYHTGSEIMYHSVGLILPVE